MTIRAVLIGDDGIYLLRLDGRLEVLLPGGWPRPGISHAVAR